MKSINRMRTIALALLFLIPVSVIAQKTKKVGLGKYHWTQLPSNPLPQDYKTYKILASSYNEYRGDDIKNYINIEGYEKVMDEKYDFKVKLKEYEMIFSEPERIREEHTRKVDGVEKKYYTYKYSFKVTHKLKVYVYNKNGESLFTKDFSESNYNYSTKSSESSETARNNYKKMKKELKANLLSDKLNSANSYLNNMIGYPKISMFVNLHTGKAKKRSKFNYDDYNEALEIAKEGVEILVQDENETGAAKEKFDNAFEIWNKALEESTPDNKKSRVNKKVTSMTYYNMMLCNFLLKEYDKAYEDIKNIQKVAKRFYDSDTMINTILDNRKREKANL